MSARALRLYVVALVTVAIGSWWQLPSGSLRAQAAPQQAGVLFGAGSSLVGQLGVLSASVTPPRPFPANISPWDDVVDASIGANHSLILRADGSVWGVGNNNLGQLGEAPAGPPGVPVSIPNLPVITKVAAGADHSLLLDDAGNVWAFGLNTNGQIGNGATSPAELHPYLVASLSNIIDIAAGDDFSLATQSDGTIWGWGNNQFLQLGTPTFGLRSTTPVVVPKGAGFLAAKVAADGHTALALSTTGQVMGWGSNSASQIGAGGPNLPTTAPFVSNIKAIAVGTSHIVLATTSGTVLTRGAGAAGQLGNGSTNNSATFVTVPGLSSVVSVGAGTGHSLAVRSDGSIWAWGNNLNRQLGIGSATASVNTPTQVTGVPTTARRVEAEGNTSFFLNAPGEIAVTTKAPVNLSCTQPFNMQVNLTGYNNVSVSPREIVLVLDESGSIDATSFGHLKSFATNLVNTLDISSTTNRVAVVMFSTDARMIISLSDQKPQILNAIAGITQRGGSTCIGCGIERADLIMDAQARPGADRTMVVVTDGVNNVNTSTFETVVTTAQQTSTLLAIGVGNDVDPDQIDFIASDIAGVKTSFLTTDFASLSLVISDLSVDVVPALSNVTLHVLLNDNFALNGNVSPIKGTVSGLPPDLQWSLPTLGAAPATINIPLLGTGHGGVLPVATAMFYSINSQPSVPLPVPDVNVTGCPAQIVLNPPSATHTVGGPHNGTVNVLDDFGTHLSLPVQVVVLSGPNVGRVFNVPALGSVFVYSSTLPGTDTLSASLPGYSINASATVQWDPINTAPVVNAGADQVVNLSGSPTANFTLTGSATDDGQIQPLSYQWTEGGAPIGNGNSVTLTRGAGTYTFVLVANDGALNGSDSVTVTVVDPTPPHVSPIVAGPSGSNGWYTGEVTVTWKVVDHESTITSPDCADALLKDDGANQIVACFAESAGGKTNASTSVNIDSVPPVVTAPSPVTADATSSAGAVVNYSGESATDATSGITSFGCSPASGSIFPIATTPVTCTATDAAGNSASATSSMTVIDPTPPVITKTITGQMGSNGWFVGDVLVSFTVNDPETAFTTAGCGPTTIASDGAFSVTCTATSAGGPAASIATGKRDATAPSVAVFAPISAPSTSAAGAIVDYSGQSADDATSGIGSLTCSPASHTSFPIGTTTVTCTATDHAGTSASASSTVTVFDATPPVVTPNVSGTMGSNGWFTSDVVVSFTVTDPETAVSTSAECSAITIGSDGSFTRTCTATSGGGSTTQAVTVKRDTTGPVVTTSASLTVPQTSPTGATVNYAAANATDATSGVGLVSCSPASGSFFNNGTTTVSCTAVDKAGNSGSDSFTVTVSDAIPPVIASTTPSESSLSPPNHQTVPITLNVVATDNLGPAPVCSIVSVSSNEPQNGLGDGDTPNDWLITGPLTVQLRSERSGNGNGRIYTISVRCVDSAGNAAVSQTTVSVPKGKK